MKRILLSLGLGLMTIFSVNSQTFYISEDFNTSTLPTGWANSVSTGTTPWGFGIDGGLGTGGFKTGNQNIDGTPLAFFDDDFLGGSSADGAVSLTTSAFNNNAVPITYLEFDYNFKEFPGIADSFYVDVFDGTNWNRVFSRSLDDCGHYITASCANGFPHATIDISAYKNANCRVRFTYFDDADWGWYVGLDNVEIWSPLPNDVAVTQVIGPNSGCGLSTDTVVAVVKNVGFNTASNFGIRYINGAQIVNETITASIAPGDSVIHTFSGLANLATVGTYNIDVVANYSTDPNTSNDTATRVVINEPIYTPTYFEDFESTGHNWKVSGANASWQRGVPNNTWISVAADGQNAFVTKLNGNYNPREISYLTSPCFDFSSSTADPIMNFSLIYLTEAGFDRFWMEYSFDNGVTWTKLLRHPTFNPVNWYNNTSVNVWEGISSAWKNVENRLNGFAGQSSVKLRFALVSDGSTQLEGVGVDKFSIRDPQPVDLAVNKIEYPTAAATPLCGYGTENIIMEYENKGTTSITNVIFSYRVDNGPIHSDTITGTNILPGQILSHQFSRRHNFSALRNYVVQAWGKVTGDSFAPNDTVPTVVVSNTTNASAFSIPYSQNFDQMTPGGAPNQGWTRTGPAGFGGWISSNGGTPSGGTGPTADATGGNYWFLETSTTYTQDPTLESPCINLSNNAGARLVYAYHMYGATMGTMYIDVFDGVQWVNGVDQIAGQQQTNQGDPWLYREVNLNQYAGRRIKIRIRGRETGTNGFQSDMAVDDIYIFEPLPRDIEMLNVVAPYAGCEVSSNAEVTVELYNRGTLDTKPDSIYVYYSVDGLPPVKDTVDFIIASEASAQFTFTQTADMGIAGKEYIVKTWTDMIGDQLDDNDTIFQYKVQNFLRTPNYFEDFETFRDALCDQPLGQVIEEGWYAPQTEYGWNVQRSVCGKSSNVTPTVSTGPGGDHTTGRGIFLYTESIDIDGMNGINNNTAVLESPCMDLTGTTTARLSFWYHKYGSQMGNLYVDVFHNGSWVNGVDQINSQTQTSADQPWKVRHVNLDAYTGSLVQIRFRGVRGGDRSDMAVDDVTLYKATNYDVGVNVVTSPNGDNCNLGSAPVTMQVGNFGTQTIPANNIRVSYQINNGTKVIDTIPTSLAVGATVNFTFPGTVDMSTPGTKEIVVEAKVNGDSLKINDRYVHYVYNQRMGLPFSTEDFERPTLDGWGRIPTSSNTYSWQKVCGPSSCIDGCVPMPPIAPNGPSGDHTFASPRQNGDGCYFMVNSNFKSGVFADAQLLFPCNSVNFANSQNGKILLSFWYHRFGAMNTQFGSMGDLFVDVHNGTQWVNGVAVIRGVQQSDDADPWQRYLISLDAFAGVSNGNIRFRAKYLGGPGNMAIDDIELLDRRNDDVAVTRFKRPQNDCGLSNTERVRVEVQNTGLNDVLQLNMCYQITFTPFDSQSVVLPMVCDSIVGILISGQNRGALYTYEFLNRADLSQPGKYEFKVWANQHRDDYAFNDTIEATVINETRPFPYCEDFSSWTYGWLAKDFSGGTYPSFWTANRNAYSWKTGIEGGSPTAGHTRGPNDVFIIADDADGVPGQIAQIETPCYDLTNTPTANLEFWYKFPMDNHVMFIDIKRGQAPWEDAVDTIYGNAVFNWTKHEFVLADYVGDFVEFRFRCINAGGFYAVDDFCVIQPPPQMIELERIVVPPMNFCQYLSTEIAELRIQNIGFTAIDSFRVVLAVDTIAPTYPRGNYLRDTMWFYKGIHYNNFEPGDKYDFTIDSIPIDMVRQIRYFFFAHVYLPGDPDTTDNVIRDYEILHPIPLQLPYITDFENNGDPYNGWLTGQNGPYAQRIWSGVDEPNWTGPGDDHTRQNGTGRYWVTDARPANVAAGQAVVLQSQCLDLSQTLNPEISYWYHMFGIDMGEMYVQVNDDYGWDNIDSLKGEQQPRGVAPWKNRVLDLGQYAGDFVRIRFLSFSGGTQGSATHMALDDIAIYDLPPMDIAPDSMCKPTEDINSCYLVNQQVELRIRNNGADSVDFTQDTAQITVYIDMEGQPWDTLYRTLSSNDWVDQNTGLLKPLPKDSSVCILMDGTFDMYHIDTTFSFHVTVRTAADLITSNDSDSYDVFTREEPGTIAVTKNPNDTVCSGEAVALTLENYFGALSWQEFTVDNRGQGFWIPGTFPNNRDVYVSNPDTLTYYRVWVCNNVYSNIDSVVAIRPYAIDTVRASKCAGDVNDLTFSINVPSNIERVYLYKEDVRDYFFQNGIVDPAAQQSVRDAMALRLIDPEDSVINPANAELGAIENGWVPSNGTVDITYTSDRSYLKLDTAFVDTIYMETYRLGCYSLINIPIFVTMEPSPNLGNMPIPNVTDPERFGTVDTLCSEEEADDIVLNAGARVGFTYQYNWEIIQWNQDRTAIDSIMTDTLQTVPVDPWQLEKNHWYSYQVTVNTPNNCGSIVGTSDTLWRYIDDKCFVGLEERSLSDKMSIYPNPTSEMLFIRYRTTDELKGDIRLRDLNGRMIINKTNVKLNENIQSIDMNELPKGVYFIQIDTPKGRVVEKIVKS